MAANQIYSVTVNGKAFNNAVINVFFYKSSAASGAANAAELRGAFYSGVIPKMLAVLSNLYGEYSIDTVNLFSPADFENWIDPSPDAGTRTGEAAPNFVALKFKSNKPASNQQPARKAFGPLSETDINGGSIIGGTFQTTNCAQLATVMGQDLVGASSSIFTPVIVKRIRYTTDKGNIAYRLPKNAGEAISFPATSWAWETLLAPQGTRKLGRGI